MNFRTFAMLAGIVLTGTACSSSSSSNPVLVALDSAGCDVEAAITGGIGQSIVSACKGTGTAAACSAAYQTALGNVNLCSVQVSSAAALVAGVKSFKKIGDVTAADLSKAKGSVKAQVAKPMGLVGSIACPIAVNTIMGYLTAQIPLACGCTVSLTASQADVDLVNACQIAVPL